MRQPKLRDYEAACSIFGIDDLLIATVVAPAIGGLLKGSTANKGVDKAAAQQQAAADAAIGFQREVFDTQQRNNAPYLAMGGNALGELGSRFGLSAPRAAVGQGGAGSANPLATLGQFDGEAYLNAPGNEDLNQEAARVVGTDPRFPTRQSYAEWHEQNFGSEGRPMGVAAQQGADQPVAQSQPAAPLTGTAAASAINPNSNTLADIFNQTLTARPAAPVRPEMTRPVVAPLDVSEAAYVKSPGYDFQLKEGQRSLLTNRAAIGGLESGEAAKSLVKYGQDYGLKDYQNWRDFTTSNFRYNTNRSDDNFALDRGRQDQVFTTDRGYTTDVYDQDRGYATGIYNNKTNDLFKLAGLGAGAVAAGTSAGQSFANNTGNILFSNADAQGNAALTKASNTGAMIDTGANLLGAYFGRNSQLQGASNPTGAVNPLSWWPKGIGG